MSVTICVDIDGTICWRNTRKTLEVCNRRLKLGIESERLQTLTYQEFLQQPEVVAYMQRRGEERAQLVIGWIDLSPEVLVAVLPIPGAVEGVQRLANLGEITYWTARYTPDSEELSRGMADATYQWLREQGFPCSDSVTFCASPQDKLTRIAEWSEAEERRVILIDDRYPKLLEVTGTLDTRLQEILRRSVTLVAFGATSVTDATCGMTVVPLMSWQAIDSLIEHLDMRKEIQHAIRSHTK